MNSKKSFFATTTSFAEKYKDHQLTGNYMGFRECHITPDWLLIYQVKEAQLIGIARTGSHSELF